MSKSRKVNSRENLLALRKQLVKSKAHIPQKNTDAHISEQEINLFQQAVKGVKPLNVPKRAIKSTPVPEPIPRQRFRDEALTLAESLSDEMDIERLLETDEQLSYRRNGIGTDVLRKLCRGYWIIQDEIDLHGMRRDEAREILNSFLQSSLRQGFRCIRIIHGKGHGSINRIPILKYKVRIWLTQKKEVLAFCQAKEIDGGSGALLVLLQGNE